MLALLTQVKDLLHPEPITVTGTPLVDYLVDQPVYDDTVILPREAPLMADAGIAVLRGNLAPRGAIIKPSAATAALLQHVGPAVVFDCIEDMRARIDDPDLDVTADSVLVLRGCGPRGLPRACPRSATCRCRASSSSRACATWCASATRG